MKKIYALLGLALLLIGSVIVGGITVNELYKKSAPSSCKDFVSRNSFIWLPEKVSDIFMGDNVILHFSMINGNTITVNGIVQESAITRLRCGRPADYDFEVWMSDVNALELATSQKPVTTFVRLWRTGQIRVEANGEENKRKLAYADQLVAGDSEPVPGWIREIFGKYVE